MLAGQRYVEEAAGPAGMLRRGTRPGPDAAMSP